jgi:hypothetical protein
MQADTFQDFPTSLMSMGKTSDDGTVSVFTKEGINIFKEEINHATHATTVTSFKGARDKPTPIRVPLVATTNNPTGKPTHMPDIKPTTLSADLSKRERLCKQQAAQLCNAATPTNPTLRISN